MTPLPSIPQRIAAEISSRENQVTAAIRLLDEGATVPFIARYRKEATGGLDDTQLRTLEERLGYLRELEERRTAILASIEGQGKLTPALRAAITTAEEKARLEDLYLPFKQKRRTKAQMAKEAGLEPLANALHANPTLTPEIEAAKYLKDPFKSDDGENPGAPDVKAALDGARQILMERFAEDADLAGELRDFLFANGVVDAKVMEGKAEVGAKFSDYFAYSEALKTIPSHRALALLRGRREQILQVALRLESEPEPPAADAPFNHCEGRIASRNGIENKQRPADRWLADTVRWTWRIKLATRLDTELMTALRDQAETEAIRVFGMNLKDLLLAAPAGARATIGLDPGLRTGVKVAVIDATGKLVDTATIYPHVPRNEWDQSIAILAALAARHQAQLVSIGNGTASRETDKLAAELMKKHPELSLEKIVVSEAGASVYSASDYAAKEFPDLDVSLRGAVSIARRLQDPLAELVKIDPKSIGVGQYQHDVNQAKLARTLTAVVEDCVNAVGVDVNTASVALLARVSGLSTAIAQNIVAHRDTNGRFITRDMLRKVPRLGDKTFEQAAGFLRIADGDNPLDASSVHPEAYPVVERILAQIGRDAKAVIGDSASLKLLDPAKFADETFGVPTVTDILRELEKPGRDPRPEFKMATFKEGVEGLKDLQAGMILEGVITNVTNFGAFVDIGVHQDGLVHISALSNKFVKDPREVVKAGDLVRVKVLEVDEKRKRIGLTMRLTDSPSSTQASAPTRSGLRDREEQRTRAEPRKDQRSRPGAQSTIRPAPTEGAMALALARLKRG